MSSQIPTHYVSKFTAGIRLLQQQMTSRLRGAVDLDTAPELQGKRASYDQLDATSMVPVTDRHGKTQITDDVHARRWITFKPSEKGSLIDRADLRRVINDPRNAYVRSHTMAAGRKIDDDIIAAFEATAVTGEEAAGTAAFDTDFSLASAVITVDRILNARQLLEAAENEEDDGDFKWHAVLNAFARRTLLNITEVTSSDFNTVKALVDGSLNTYLGFTFLKSERLPLATTDRDLFIWVKSSMKAAMSQDVVTFMDILPERRHSVQVRTEIDTGATRMDEKGVVRMIDDQS